MDLLDEVENWKLAGGTFAVLILFAVAGFLYLNTGQTQTGPPPQYRITVEGTLIKGSTTTTSGALDPGPISEISVVDSTGDCANGEKLASVEESLNDGSDIEIEYIADADSITSVRFCAFGEDSREIYSSWSGHLDYSELKTMAEDGEVIKMDDETSDRWTLELESVERVPLVVN